MAKRVKKESKKIVKEQLLVKGISYTEKELLVFQPVSSGYMVYNGENKWLMDEKEFKDISKKPRSAKYMPVKCDDKVFRTKNCTLEEFYAKYKEAADKLKKASRGLINLYKTGALGRTAINLFYYFVNKKKILPEKIEYDEAQWIENATKGALIWATKYEGKGYKYDINSMYPSLMAKGGITYPIKRGEFNTLSSLDSISYGIYRCKITAPEGFERLFRFNRKNYYTSFDIKRALELKMKVELICDGKPNALIYTPEKRIPCMKLFNNYIYLLWRLKTQSVPLAKKILNALWGALCRMRKITYSLNKNTRLDFDDSYEILTYIYDDETDFGKVSIVQKNDYYETDFARMKPFLLALGRNKISRIIEPFIDDVVHIHTDGFICKKNPNLPTSEDNLMGNIRFEGESNSVKINHSCDYSFN